MIALDAEAAFLGCLLQISAPFVTAGYLEQVEPEDFHDPRHRAVVGAMRELVARKVPVDPVTVLGELRRSGAAHAIDPCPDAQDMRDVGVFLAELLEATPLAASVGHYLDVLLEARLRREIAKLGQQMAQAAEGSSLDGLRSWLADGIGGLRHHLNRLDARTAVSHD